MSTQPEQQNRRILVIDDNDAIHRDFRKILGDRTDTAVLDELRTSLLGVSPTAPESIRYEIDTASQGQEGLEKVRQALEEDSPYSLAFVDMRMPPGWDGLETIEQIWRVDPTIQIVICTAYSDYSWKDIHERLGQTDGLLILKKPFDNVEVRQLACALTQKWYLARQAQLDVDDLESTIQQRTAELQFEISDRRQAQTALQEREAKTRAILQAAADG
ncbi:MAG: response regulator, partial [Planctomycetes bacterium]|nr:response regulator [Planctomycetota bacterium]